MPEEPLPPSDRPILALFDVDNTLMRGTSLFQLGREAWKRRIIRARDIALFGWHQVRFIMVGENDEHLASSKERALGLLGGHSETQILELADSIWEHRIRPRLYPDTVKLAQDHIARGHQVWLVSATPLVIGERMAQKLGLTGALGSQFESKDGVFTGRIIGHILHHQRKAEAVRELAEREGADLAESWAYSDSRNDIPLLELVGHPTVVNPDVALMKHAHDHHWPIMRLRPSSIREARRRLRREARDAKKVAE
jgi:HAD superfamily hydrolase (TIGR01490 family)